MCSVWAMARVGRISDAVGSDWLVQRSCEKQEGVDVLAQILEDFGGRWTSCSFLQKPRACDEMQSVAK